MTPSFPSCRVHKIVEYVKSVGFDLETDELEEQNLQELLQDGYDICTHLSDVEEQSLRRELHVLASINEMREAQVKARELFPEDQGIEFVRGLPQEELVSGDAWPVFYSYPVDEALKLVPLRRPKSETNVNSRINDCDLIESVIFDQARPFRCRCRVYKSKWLENLGYRGFFSNLQRSPCQGV